MKSLLDRRIFLLSIAACIVFGSIVSEAQSRKLSRADRKWMQEEVFALITPEEIRIFTELRSKADRKRFKEMFWRRRDPDVMTPENELQIEIRKRISYADMRFQYQEPNGSLSDLGVVYVLFGAPAENRDSGKRSASSQFGRLAAGGGNAVGSLGDEISQLTPTGMRFASTPSKGRFAAGASKLDWLYSPNAVVGIPDGIHLTFQQQRSGWVLDRTEEVEQALSRIKGAYIFQPELTYELDVKGRLLEPASKFHPNSPAKRALRELMDDKRGKADIAFETASTFFHSGKRSYIPLRFDIDPAVLSWDKGRAKVTVFGSIEDLEDELVHRFEEQAILVRNDGEPSTFDIPLRLEPGTYTFNLGVLDDKTKMWGAKRAPVFVPGFDGGSLQMSSVVLYTESQKTEDASPTPGNAFQFGSRRFTVPGSRVWRPTDRAGILFFVYGISQAEAELTVDYNVLRDGQSANKLEGLPLEAHQGQAVGNVEIPLVDLLPGSYRVHIRVTDHIRNEVVEKQVDFFMEPASYSLVGYSELIKQYRAGDIRAVTGALSSLSGLEVLSVAQAADDYRKQKLTDDELRMAALFHTDAAMTSGSEATHFNTARKYLRQVGDKSVRRRWEQLWFLAISEHIANSPTAWNAFPLVKQALQFFPADLNITLAAGMVHEAMGARGAEGKLIDAETLYRSILEKEPDHGEARVRLGRVLQLQGRKAEALKELKFALSQRLGKTLKLVTFILLGELRDGMGNTVQAIDSYQAAVEINPECQAATIALSRALLRAGNAEASDQAILKFLRHARSQPEAPDLWLQYIGGNVERIESILTRLRPEISK